MRSTLRSTLPTTVPAVAATAAAALLLAAAPASAHVHAVPDATAADGYSVVTFRVPNESDSAATTSVQVQLPTDHPFTWVAVKPVAGWSATVAEGDLPAPVQVDGATVTKAPLTITWTAEPGAAGIGVGQFEEFAADVGPLPAEGTRVVLPTVQTYADGEVSRWTEVADPGAEEPAEPAPEFTTTAAEGGHGAGAHAEQGAAAAGSGAGADDSAAQAAGSGASDGLARGLGGAGLLLGLAALVVALLRHRGTARA
ncbi:YcnI family copper-binding membrane protein [Kineococcus sp. SYSU DK006]|uniref:YcnI family copper-binding membrane protein n=1 Tax=Kineococcus sp. SYSU DK006 TaxID=3383127 RepID=UPI003D7DCF05